MIQPTIHPGTVQVIFRDCAAREIIVNTVPDLLHLAERGGHCLCPVALLPLWLEASMEQYGEKVKGTIDIPWLMWVLMQANL